jgi:4-hydroxy-tetrahydrodipicolinate synthase
VSNALPTGGTHVLLVTPFDMAYGFDDKSMHSLIDHVVSQGVQGVVALGTTGEFFTLAPRERAAVIDTVVSAVAGRVAVTVGVGADSTSGAVELAQHAQAAGADCVMVLPPLYSPAGTGLDHPARLQLPHPPHPASTTATSQSFQSRAHC